MIFDDIFCSSPHENNKFDKKNKLLDATKNNEKKVTNGAPEEGAPLLSEKKLLMAHQWVVRHCYSV